MDIFFSDLDNTLIYSHRHHLLEDKIPVEYLNGREQSFMTRAMLNTLKNMARYHFVPVSTRTEPQYNRLKCMDVLHPKYAIICNGGKLMIDGKEDKFWTNETYQLTISYEESLQQAIDAIHRILPTAEGHRPERYMFYMSVESPKLVCRSLSHNINTNEVEVRYDSRKVYLFSKGVNKGQAISRFKERFDVGSTIAAGDNEMDISMLNEVDIALAAEKIYPYITTPKRIKLVGEEYSSQISEVLRNTL